MNLTDPSNWIVVGATLFVVSLCVILHYEVLTNCSRLLSHINHDEHRRVRTVGLIFVILVTHVIEMWFFAFGYFFLSRLDGLGSLTGVEVVTLADFAYYSATVYTTVGFGDIVPVGPMRFMTGMEGLTGLVMITWSASFTFLSMQRYWQSD